MSPLVEDQRARVEHDHGCHPLVFERRVRRPVAPRTQAEYHKAFWKPALSEHLERRARLLDVPRFVELRDPREYRGIAV